LVIVTVAGQVGRIYEIQATQNFSTWTSIGTVTADATGLVSFIDLNASKFKTRYYRARDTQS
jgi:hypothetical protein